MTWARDRAYQCLSLKALVSKFYVKLKGSLRCHAAPPTYLWVVLLPPKILHVRWCVMRCDYGVIKKGETDDRTPHPAKPLEWSNPSYLCEWCVVRGSGGRRGLGLEERASKAPPISRTRGTADPGLMLTGTPHRRPAPVSPTAKSSPAGFLKAQHEHLTQPTMKTKKHNRPARVWHTPQHQAI